MGQITRWERSLPIGMGMEKYELRLVSQQPWAHGSPSHTKGSHTLQEHWCGKTEKVGGGSSSGQARHVEETAVNCP